MKAVGKEAVDELRASVKNELEKTIKGPIKTACLKFVNDGNDYGPGVRDRILELFDELAKRATTAARAPAIKILQENAERIRQDIERERDKGGDPLQDTADLIVERHELRQRRSNAQKRPVVLQAVKEVLTQFPGEQAAPAVDN